MKKALALLLSVMLVLCAVPMTAFADGTTTGGTNGSATTDPAKTDISKAVVTLEKTEYTYTGKEIKPAVTSVKLTEEGTAGKTEKTLTAGTDYEVAYTGNTNAGTAAVTVTGKGTYEGSASASFTIGAKTFTDADGPAIEIPNQKKGAENNTLTGLSVVWGENILKAGTDFEVTCDNSKTGSQTAVLTFKGNYAGSVTRNYDVVENGIEEAGIYLKDLNASYTFTGKAQEPAVEVRIGTLVLTEGKDYTVAYENNVKASVATAPAKILVTGMGAYSGTIEKTFTILPAKMSDCKVVFTQDAYTATGAAIVPTYTVTLGDYTLKVNEDYTAALSNNVAIGEGKLTLTGNRNFTGTLEAKFSIVSKAISDMTVRVVTPEVAYDGQAKTPAVEVKDGNVVLTTGTDYTVKYEDNINAGKAKAIVTGAGRYAGTATVEFTIKGTANKVTTAYTSYTKYLTSKVFNLKASATGNEAGSGFAYTSSNENVVRVTTGGDVIVVGTGKATITVKTTGTKAYDPAEKVVTVTVKPLKPVLTLTSPAKKQVKVVFTKVKGATRYQVRYGRNGVYYYKNIKHLDNQYTKTSTLLKNRVSGKKYYVKVRAITEMEDGTVVYGNWTSVKSIKSK